MNRTKYGEDQLIGILTEHEAGAKYDDLCRKQGMSKGIFLRLEGQVLRHDGFRCQAAEAAGSREREAEETAGEQIRDAAAMKELLSKKR